MDIFQYNFKVTNQNIIKTYKEEWLKHENN